MERLTDKIQKATPETRERWFVAGVLICGALAVGLWLVYFSSLFTLEEAPSGGASAVVRESILRTGAYLRRIPAEVVNFLKTF